MRDRRTMMIVVFIPVVLLLLFGFAISTEVNSIRIACVVPHHNDVTRGIVQRYEANAYFDFIGIITHNEIDELLRVGKADVVVVLDASDNGLKTQVIVDASNTSTAQSVSAYAQSIIHSGSNSPILTETLYNPQLKSAYNFVPGILGMIVILICTMMTSVSIVSEKERGTMDLLLVSPIRPGVIILGKLIPYFLLSCVILVVMLTISYTVLELPLCSTIWWVVVLTLVYVVMSLSIGLMVSTILKTQVTALMVSAMVFMIPVIMLSGMIFPIENMPECLQWISSIVPARWYISAMRKLMIEQLGPSYIVEEMAILVGMMVLFFTGAMIKFRKQSSNL